MTMTTTGAHRALRFGVRFNPTAEEAVALYLRRRVVGEPLPDVAGIIHEADVYKLEPKELAAAYPRLPRTQNRFFFTTCMRKKAGRGYRMSRAGDGPGSWVGSGDKKDVENGAGETIGYRETLKYAYRDKSRKSDWRMEEYHCCGLDDLAVVNGEERVFCRVYVLPNSKPGSVTLQESAAGDRLLGMQEPSSAMAAAAQQQQLRQPATTVQQQQQQPQPRRQEPVAPVLPSITPPPPPPPPPRALDVPSVPRQPCVTNTQQAPNPKRPAPQVVEEPARPKRMRPSLTPLQVPPVPRLNMVAINTPNLPSWYRSALATSQRQARASPTAAPRPRPRKSSRSSHRVAPPPPPTDEAPTNDDEDWSSFVADLDSSISQEEAGNDDDLARLAQPEMVPEENHAMIQEEAGNDDDDLARLAQPEMVPEDEENHAMIQEEAGNDDDDFSEWLVSQIEEMPAVEGKIQEEEEEGQGQHDARSLEGFLVADERGDDVTAQDVWDTIGNFGDDVTGDIDFTLPLSAYGDIQF